MSIPFKCPSCHRTISSDVSDQGSAVLSRLTCPYCGKSWRVNKKQDRKGTTCTCGNSGVSSLSKNQHLDLSIYWVGDLIAATTLCLVFAVACAGCAFLVIYWWNAYPDYFRGIALGVFALACIALSLIGIVCCLGPYFKPTVFSVVPKPDRKERFQAYSGLAIFCGLAVIIFLLTLEGYQVHIKMIRPFQELISAKHRFLHLSNPVDITANSGHTPYFRGKGVIVDLDKKRIEIRLQERLPMQMRASDPNEVSTIVRLRRGMKKVGEYVSKWSSDRSGGPGAYQSYCTVEIIDVARAAVVAKTTLWGSDPPVEIRGSEKHIGDEVSEEAIIHYVWKLRRIGTNDIPSSRP